MDNNRISIADEGLTYKKNFLDMEKALDQTQQNSIETGYFIFTMMPSLRCKLRCPHCYLSLEQRTTSPIMTNEQLKQAAQNVADYYKARPHIKNKVILFYWYGGEPTQMGKEYFLTAFHDLEEVFPASEGYTLRHEILTALVGVREDWFPIFDHWGAGHFQTSFDGLMRGASYVKVWEKQVKKAVDYGLNVSTISVVNHELVKDSPEVILDYLTDLGIKEASFLPFMLNEQNQGEQYETFAPPMQTYSDFMIRLHNHWRKQKRAGRPVPQIGQASFIVSRNALKNSMLGHNIAGQTLFMLPEGEMVLPDYRDGYLEYMNEFGNILKQPFEEILSSPARRKYLRRQVNGNLNEECLSCEHKSSCIMEFWKPNREGDECFGAKQYVEHVLETERVDPMMDDLRSVIY